MADSITLNNARGMAAKTGLDPANSGTIGTTAGARRYVEGPPLNGAANSVGRWALSAYGTQTDSNSLTAATYNWEGDAPYYTVAPTTYTYVSTGL